MGVRSNHPKLVAGKPFLQPFVVSLSNHKGSEIDFRKDTPMVYDEQLAERVRHVLNNQDGIRERKMFGGLAFMLHGNMSVGVINDELMVRVGPDRHQEALEQPHARPMDFTGRPMKGFVFVPQEGIATDADFRGWVQLGVEFAESLPRK